MNKLRQLLERIQNKKYKVLVERLDTASDDSQYDREIKKVMNLLAYTKRSSVSYSAGAFETGYHTLSIGKYKFKGQRDPKLRFKDLPLSLDNLSVLDIGCNQGGMLHTFSNEIRFGVGIDYDSRMINAANKIKSYTKTDNLDFYVFDLENEELSYIHDLIPTGGVDVVFMLSVAKWINTWREVITFCAELSSKMVFETNGTPAVQDEQIAYLKRMYKNVDLVNARSEDDRMQKNRQLLFCH